MSVVIDGLGAAIADHARFELGHHAPVPAALLVQEAELEDRDLLAEMAAQIEDQIAEAKGHFDGEEVIDE